MVFHGLDGLDEISTIGKTMISWLKNREIKTFEVAPSCPRLAPLPLPNDELPV